MVRQLRKAKSKPTNTSEDIDEPIKLFETHGIVFKTTSGNQKIGRCPFCKKPNKFYVNTEDGRFECKACTVFGNRYTFLQKIYDYWLKKTTKQHRARLGKLRGGFPGSMYLHSGIAYRADDSSWLFPSRNPKGSMVNIGIWSGRKGTPISNTPTCKTHLGGVDKIKDHGPIYIVEGQWKEHTLRYFLSKKLPAASVVSSSAGTFKEEWLAHFRNRDIIIVMDNDKAGEEGLAKRVKMLSTIGPRSMKSFHWPESYPEGYGIDDFILDHFDDLDECWELFNKLIKTVIKEGKSKSLTIDKFTQVISHFKKLPIHFTSSMREALAIIYATITSARDEGDPLWLFLTGPPGSSKTLLLQNTSNNEYTHFESKLGPRTLVSGWKSADGEDQSLLPKIIGKTLFVKDWTEMMSEPKTTQSEVYGVLTGVFDGRVDKTHANGLGHKVYPDPSSPHKTCHFSIIAGVTDKIYGDNRAAMGDRFLKYRLDVGDTYAQVKQAMENAKSGVRAEVLLQDVSEAFLTHLRQVDIPKINNRISDKIISLANVAENMRIQVERHQGVILYPPVVGVATRICKQLTRMSIYLAMVFGEKEVNERIYSILQKIALDTPHPWYRKVFMGVAQNPNGITRDELARRYGLTMSTADRHMNDLRETGALMRFKDLRNGKKVNTPTKLGAEAFIWKLSPHMKEAYRDSRLSQLK